jgi:hypothetical protein
MSTLIFLSFVSSLATFLAIRDYQRRGRLPYLPGPRRLPSIGNLCGVPKEHGMNHTLVELYLKERMTGDFFGQIIVLNSVKATKGLLGLLERRSYTLCLVIPVHEMYVFLVKHSELEFRSGGLTEEKILHITFGQIRLTWF